MALIAVSPAVPGLLTQWRRRKQARGLSAPSLSTGCSCSFVWARCVGAATTRPRSNMRAAHPGARNTGRHGLLLSNSTLPTRETGYVPLLHDGGVGARDARWRQQQVSAALPTALVAPQLPSAFGTARWILQTIWGRSQAHPRPGPAPSSAFPPARRVTPAVHRPGRTPPSPLPPLASVRPPTARPLAPPQPLNSQVHHRRRLWPRPRAGRPRD